MSLELPTVSVIVLAERDNYLPATIDSICQQTYKDFEICVFSRDRHSVSSWFKEQSDPRLQFFFSEDLNLAATLNRGILAAKGKYISFIRAGDLWHPQKLEQQIFALECHPEIGLIHTCSILLPPQRQATVENVSLPQHSLPVKKTFRPIKALTLLQSSEILAQNQICLASVMVRRQCFETVGQFEPQLEAIPDWEMWIRLRKYYQFMAIAEPLVYCHQSFALSPNYWLTLEKNLHTIIETAYADLAPELEQQKHYSYSYASLFLARNILQTKNPDPAIARNYWYQALAQDPWLLLAPAFCQLRWEIFRLDCRQSNFSGRLPQLIAVTESRLLNIMHKISHFSHNLLNWMLEEEDNIHFWHSPKVKQQGKD